jgi:hypothetical protein
VQTRKRSLSDCKNCRNSRGECRCTDLFTDNGLPLQYAEKICNALIVLFAEHELRYEKLVQGVFVSTDVQSAQGVSARR